MKNAKMIRQSIFMDIPNKWAVKKREWTGRDSTTKGSLIIWNLCILTIIFLSAFISAAGSSTDDVISNPNTTTIFLEEPVIIIGNNCSPTGEHPSEKEITLNVPESGQYKIFARASRGSITQLQTDESYFLQIGNKKGPVSNDDAGEEEFSIRIDFLGTFKLSKGLQKATIKNAAQCPPSISENSVSIDAFFLLKIADNEEDEDRNDDRKSSSGRNGRVKVFSLIDCNDPTINYPEKDFQCRLEKIGQKAQIKTIPQYDISPVTKKSNLNNSNSSNLNYLSAILITLIALIIILAIIIIIFAF